ncbi:unnamed protein product [Schistosoma margrebowiei]|uniref:Uncharacterized protein n=1 Tax=Schistosoma margrebowiei TaxID=48269 RepID=A0A183LR87_9TREM|nr:unnamed protein product [Schistosoma margrebowiei]
MKTFTSGQKHGIQWAAWMQPDDLDFTDDLALLSHTHQQMQMKATGVAAASASNTNPITPDEEALEYFTYLNSIVDKQGGSDADVKARIGKQGQHSYSGRTYGTQNNCQPISK